MKLFTPDVRKDRVTDITAETLRALGAKGVVVDLDNTLGGYGDPLPPEDVIAWAASVKDAGFGIYIAQQFGKGEFSSVRRDVITMSIFLDAVTALRHELHRHPELF